MPPLKKLKPAKPFACKACADTGRSSKGGPCEACRRRKQLELAKGKER